MELKRRDLEDLTVDDLFDRYKTAKTELETVLLFASLLSDEEREIFERKIAKHEHEANVRAYMIDFGVTREQAEKELEVHSMHGKADIDPDTFMAIYNDTEDEDDGI